MALIGILLGSIGTDVNSGLARYTMDMAFLQDGVGLISIALGCFGIAEIVKNLDARNTLTPFNGKIKLLPTWPEFKRIIPSALRGSVIGSVLGILPGGGPTIAQFAAYAADKRFSKHREEIGSGAIEGVAGQAAADEAAARTSFIPLMAIGIPENAVMALMLAAFIVKGIQPGPNMIGTHPDLFWGLVASMWIGNCFLLILNVPLVRYWLSVFKIPYTVLFPSILFFCCIGTFSINNSLDDIYITAVFGAIGYLFMRLGMEPAPLMLGFILGPMLEENFRRAMLLSRGDFSTFVTRPISGTLFGVIGLIVVWQLVSFMRNSRKKDAPACIHRKSKGLSEDRAGRLGVRRPDPAARACGPEADTTGSERVASCGLASRLMRILTAAIMEHPPPARRATALRTTHRRPDRPARHPASP